MTAQVQFSTKAQFRVGRTKMTFRVERGAGDIAILTVDNNGLTWKPFRRDKSVRFPWEKFNQLIEAAL